MYSLDNIALSPKASSTFTFHKIFSNSTPSWTTFVKRILDLMLGFQYDQITALWKQDNITFTFYCILASVDIAHLYTCRNLNANLPTCILAYLHTCTLAYCDFYTISKSDLKWLMFRYNRKQSAAGQYWSISENISQSLTILGYISQYGTKSDCSLQ